LLEWLITNESFHCSNKTPKEFGSFWNSHLKIIIVNLLKCYNIELVMKCHHNCFVLVWLGWTCSFRISWNRLRSLFGHAHSERLQGCQGRANRNARYDDRTLQGKLVFILYCVVSIHVHSASHRALHSEVLELFY